MPKMRKKQDLPVKPCAACGRPFAWRRKWARDWDEVKYCSDRCRAGTAKAGTRAQAGDTGGEAVPPPLRPCAAP